MSRVAKLVLCVCAVTLVAVHAGDVAEMNSDDGSSPQELGEGKASSGEDKLLTSKKILPETRKQKDTVYGTKVVLKTYASADCSGKPKGTKTVRGCKKTSDIQQCPSDMWSAGFVCKKTEKKTDEVFNQKWKWGIYKNQFVMRYQTEAQPWKHTEVGKKIGVKGDESCFTWSQDLQQVFLMQSLNAPSCKAHNNYGQTPKGDTDNGVAFLATGAGSFRFELEAPRKMKTMGGKKRTGGYLGSRRRSSQGQMSAADIQPANGPSPLRV